MLITFSVLLICQCLGEAIAFLLRLPVPGPVIGMSILFCALVLYPKLLATMQASCDALLQHLSLLFVPAGVGIFAAAASLHGQWLAIVGAVVTSTVITLAVTALVMRALSPAAPDARGDGEGRHE
jgi:holin-like protein